MTLKMTLGGPDDADLECESGQIPVSTDGAPRPQRKPGPRERVLTAFSLAFFRAFGPLIRRAIHRGIAGPTSS